MSEPSRENGAHGPPAQEPKPEQRKSRMVEGKRKYIALAIVGTGNGGFVENMMKQKKN